MAVFLSVWNWITGWVPDILLAWAAAILLSFAWSTVRALRQQRQQRLDKLIADEQARIDQIIMTGRAAWPSFHSGDLSHCRNCLIGRDNDYLPVVIPCPEHKPAGRHHATAPVYGPEPVVAEPAFDEWVDEWNRRYSE